MQSEAMREGDSDGLGIEGQCCSCCCLKRKAGGIVDSCSQHGCFATIGCGVANRKAGGIVDSHSQLGCFGACSWRQCNKWTATALALQAGVGVGGVVAKR